MLDQKLDAFISKAKSLPWTTTGFYPIFIAQIYFLTTYSVKMLAAAASVTDRPEYYRHLMQNIREEIGHDKIALSDLKAMGFSAEDFEEFGITRAIWESQLYKIQRCPDALIGYIFALEKSAVEVYNLVLPALTEKYGTNAVKFVRLHAEEDQEHVKNAWDQIQKLSPASKKEALINANQACEMLSHLFDEILSVVKMDDSKAA